MKKLLIFITGILLLALLTLIVLFFALQSQYATPVINQLLERLSPWSVSIQSIKYNYPNHFTAHDIVIAPSRKKPLKIGQVDLWINSLPYQDKKIVIDSLLLKNVEVQQNQLTQPTFFKQLTFKQIAIENLNYTSDNTAIKNLNLQIKKPYWRTEKQLIPYGALQLSATQLDWQSESFHQPLIDIDYAPKNSTLYGLSFSWRDSDVSTQAKQGRMGWNLINTTVSGLNLTALEWQQISKNNWQPWLNQIAHIDQLDLLNTELELPTVQLSGLDLTVKNLSAPFQLWQQKGGEISLNADSIIYSEQLLIEPSFNALLNTNLIQLKNFNAGYAQGQIQINGELSPQAAHLTQLDINGLKWIIENKKDSQWIMKYLQYFETLSIDNLNIDNSQIIQLTQKPYWQVTGTTVNANHAKFIRNYKVGLWDGELKFTANSASYQNVIATQALIQMHSKNGTATLDYALIPLEKGLVEASGAYSFSKKSQPWNFTMSADGLPLSLFSNRLALPENIQGITEFTVQSSGLAGDYLMLSHSLSGKLTGTIREGVIHADSSTDNSTDREKSQPATPFESSTINIIADRGRLTVQPITLSGQEVVGQIAGQLDLAPPQQGKITFELKKACSHIQGDLATQQFTQTTSSECISKILTEN